MCKVSCRRTQRGIELSFTKSGSREVITILKYLDRQLTKRERRTVIRYLRQYKNLEAIIYSKEMDLIPSRSSEFKETPVQESNEFHSQAEERSEEHTSELQSRGHLVCRLLLEKKNNKPLH